MEAHVRVGQDTQSADGLAADEVESARSVLAALDVEIAKGTGMNVVWTEMRDALRELLKPF